MSNVHRNAHKRQRASGDGQVRSGLTAGHAEFKSEQSGDAKGRPGTGSRRLLTARFTVRVRAPEPLAPNRI